MKKRKWKEKTIRHFHTLYVNIVNSYNREKKNPRNNKNNIVNIKKDHI